MCDENVRVTITLNYIMHDISVYIAGLIISLFPSPLSHPRSHMGAGAETILIYSAHVLPA